MQELKHCKIAQGLEIANKQQQGAVGDVLGGGGGHLKPYFLFTKAINLRSLSLYSKHPCHWKHVFSTSHSMKTTLGSNKYALIILIPQKY